MNRLIVFIVSIFFLTQCTLSNKISPWKNEKKEIQDIKITEKVLSDDKKIITEFNQDLKLDFSTEEHHGRYGKDLDDLILLNADKALGSGHEEVHLLKHEGGVGEQGFRIPEDLPAGGQGVVVIANVTHQEGYGALRIQQA